MANALFVEGVARILGLQADVRMKMIMSGHSLLLHDIQVVAGMDKLTYANTCCVNVNCMLVFFVRYHRFSVICDKMSVRKETGNVPLPTHYSVVLLCLVMFALIIILNYYYYYYFMNAAVAANSCRMTTSSSAL